MNLNKQKNPKKPKKFIIVEDDDIMDEKKILSDTINLVDTVKLLGINWVKKMLEKRKKITLTKPGSLTYLLYGARPSEQSINIKLGRLGEYLAKELIKLNPSLELLTCGVQEVNGKRKDIDLKFKNKEKNIIHVRELKANIELDTEKLIATTNKCKDVETDLKNKNPECDVDFGILNWSVYDRSILTAGLNHIKTFENSGIKIEHMGDFLEVIDIKWDKSDYETYFKYIGEMTKLN